MKYIFTCQPNASKIALSEYKKEDPSVKFIDWLDSGVGLIESDLSNEEMVQLIFTTPIIFTRHIFAVDSSFDRTDTPEELANQCLGFALGCLSQDATFSVQARTLDTDTMKSYRNEFRDHLSSLLSEQGYEEDKKKASQILSAFITNKTVYLGCGSEHLNLSSWNGGMMHCAKEGMISRAEFKLLEAVEVFGIDINNHHNAADLGAAPGGWSNELLNYGLKVTAIDPAKMDRELLKNPNLTHFKEMTQTYLERDLDTTFDLVVNDMKMDVIESASITNEFDKVLSEDGLVLMTFKLPNKYSYLNVKHGMEELNKCYDLVTARQLFHNRSEVTVLYRKKSL